MERYSEDNPISTKVKILILESYYITNFSDSGIDLYNSENTLREFLNGNKIPTEGNTLIFAIIHTFANFTIKECDGVLYFDKRNILKNIFLDYLLPNITKKKGETVSSLLKEFENYIDSNGINNYICKKSFMYTLNP